MQAVCEGTGLNSSYYKMLLPLLLDPEKLKTNILKVTDRLAEHYISVSLVKSHENGHEV